MVAATVHCTVMGKTAAGGSKPSARHATVVLAGALGCFAAGYSAHAVGSATKTIKKAVETRLPASIKNLLPAFAATSYNPTGVSASAIPEAKPVENAPRAMPVVLKTADNSTCTLELESPPTQESKSKQKQQQQQQHQQHQQNQQNQQNQQKNEECCAATSEIETSIDESNRSTATQAV